MIHRLGVVGAGTMGAGIAQVAILGGFETAIYELDGKALERGLEQIRDGTSNTILVTEKRLLFDLLGGEKQAGVQLTENFAMTPPASVCGFYFAHPQARYFALGKIARDQVQDYHRRKGIDLRAVERWLAPHLGYEPSGA